MIDEAKIKKVQDRIKAAILKIEAEENIKIDFGTVSYNKAFYTSKMIVKTLEKTKLLVMFIKLSVEDLGSLRIL